MTPAVLSALAEGAIAVTPNRRLARHLHVSFDRAQRAAGRRSWPTPTILPFATWLETLWQRATTASSEVAPSRLLAPSQAILLWRHVIDSTSGAFLDTAGAATLAAEAWTLMHAWGAGGESWRAWSRAEASEDDDPSTFAAWAEAYLATLRRALAVDAAQLADVLARCATDVDAPNMRAVLVGFIDYTPQQNRLITALRAAGAEIRSLDGEVSHGAAASRTTAATPRDEVCAALAWARCRALADPACRIGIVIEDLAQRRDEIVALAEDVLCPGLVLPARVASRRPFEVSLGTPLASVPLALAALDLIALREVGLARNDAAALLRSPYLHGAETAWPRRSRIERDWLGDGRTEVTLDDALAALDGHSPELAERWRRTSAATRHGRIASTREWADAWRAWLAAAGWPGSRPLDSAEYQALDAWERLLSEFVRLGAVSPGLERRAAVETLRWLARERIFQPEGGPAQVQILGLLEASGLEFDALWVAGLSADRWPRAPTPNPLLPLVWQRERNVPQSSPACELAYARELTLRFASAAPVVMFSSAESADDHPLLPSALLLDYPPAETPVCDEPWAQRIFSHDGNLEKLIDDRAPPVPAGSRAPGGSAIIASQSDCPFQAVARHRLHVAPWPVTRAALSPEERGQLAHAALATFWASLRDRATLAALGADALAARIDASVTSALSRLRAARLRTLPRAARRAEAGRLAAVLRAWIDVELARPPFVVAGVEMPATLALGPLTFSMRLDRVDALGDGGTAIIDYKTGRAIRPRQWFDERPQAPQLGMYALAQREAKPGHALRALAYAQLRAEAIAPIGLAADAAAWPALTELAALTRFNDWAALEAWWRAHLGALATEIATGIATVAPRAHPSPCRTCGLHALCRIQTSLVDDGDDANG